jgi:hypothetical protein
MSRPALRTVLTSYAVAWLYLAGFIAVQVAYAALSPHDQAVVLGWASTNVHNLRHHPVGCLVASAFVTQTYATAWPVLIALAMFGANGVLGNWRTAFDLLWQLRRRQRGPLRVDQVSGAASA